MDNYYNLHKLAALRNEELQNEAEAARLGRNLHTDIDAPRQANALVRLLNSNKRGNRR